MKQPKITEYRIIEGHIHNLVPTINRAINEGWHPLGAPFLNDSVDRLTAQAMVKYEKEEPEKE